MFKLLVYWALSTIGAWAIFVLIMMVVSYLKYRHDPWTFLTILNMVNDYADKEPLWLEWERFIIWPYGIISRILLICKVSSEYKKQLQEKG